MNGDKAPRLCAECGEPLPERLHNHQQYHVGECRRRATRRIQRRCQKEYRKATAAPGVKRPCLGCGTLFRSTWAGHRFCAACNDRIEATATRSVPVKASVE